MLPGAGLECGGGSASDPLGWCHFKTAVEGREHTDKLHRAVRRRAHGARLMPCTDLPTGTHVELLLPPPAPTTHSKPPRSSLTAHSQPDTE